ncbi:MAG: ATP-binding cassette domain-containing protein, partial [Marmoricola sp.]|nr:ATP-binding cassette domain-containing protein [Marmoricola sp.]
KNLAMLGASIGAPRSKVDAVLAEVWLSERAKDPFHTYSLGMRQRLAIAAALLKSPDLLVLDEPTNGLDPAGIQGIRELVRNLGESGVTVLLSSHILAEVQQVCHSVSIIGEGSLLASGAVGDLLGQGIARTRVRVGDPAGAVHFLTTAGYDVKRTGEDLLVEGDDRPEEITRTLAERHIYVREIVEVRPTLESFFLKLTGRHEEAPVTEPEAEEEQ